MTEHALQAQNMIDAVAEIMGGRSQMNYLVHISEESGFVYFGNPNACHARMLGSMNIALAAARGQELVFSKMGDIFQSELGRMTKPSLEGDAVFADMLDDPDTFKFTFVRDPVSRFIKAYRDKLSPKTPNAPQRQKAFEYLGLQLNQNLSLSDLAAEMAKDSELGSMVLALQKQRNLTAFDLVDYSYIGQHDNWDQDFALISSYVFGHPVIPFDPLATFGRDRDGVNITPDVDAATLANLEIAYADDFEMLEEIAAMGLSTPPEAS